MTSNEAVEALLHSCSWKWSVRNLFQDMSTIGIRLEPWGRVGVKSRQFFYVDFLG
jgi:hypothetical protein